MRPLRTPLLLGVLGLTAWAGTAAAHAGAASATGAQGQTLTVSETSGLKAGGETVTVSGKGFDTRKGIYVAFCKDNGPGEAPSPCGGGADMAGSTGASHWISDNPPPYGRDLAVRYGEGGTFSVTLTVSAKLSGTVDCAKTRCVVASRADHTRGQDRTQDVRVPVSFDEGGVPVAVWGGGAAAAAVAVTGGAFLVLRRRRDAGDAR
ncbi:hypothetical protein [Actinomadura bangladeshensis]|uniref:hypothetical protein n=1 Tax=Actinomadura bangladeshensis TaxID=453573 RepID=UPI001941B270|nr:hypothetical protein [Actinomadura bangladeshensis]